MSRKMIDYQIESGKIKSIDGYKVGGDELHFKTISGEKTIYHNPDDANELSQLSNGTWLKQISRSFPLIIIAPPIPVPNVKNILLL